MKSTEITNTSSLHSYLQTSIKGNSRCNTPLTPTIICKYVDSYSKPGQQSLLYSNRGTTLKTKIPCPWWLISMNNVLQPSHTGIRSFHNSNNTKKSQCSTKIQWCVVVSYGVKFGICKINLFKLPKSRKQLLSKVTSPSKLSLKLHISLAKAFKNYILSWKYLMFHKIS
jgi:hypothetical protein